MQPTRQTSNRHLYEISDGRGGKFPPYHQIPLYNNSNPGEYGGNRIRVAGVIRVQLDYDAIKNGSFIVTDATGSWVRSGPGTPGAMAGNLLAHIGLALIPGDQMTQPLTLPGAVKMTAVDRGDPTFPDYTVRRQGSMTLTPVECSGTYLGVVSGTEGEFELSSNIYRVSFDSATVSAANSWTAVKRLEFYGATIENEAMKDTY